MKVDIHREDEISQVANINFKIEEDLSSTWCNFGLVRHTFSE